jgi:sec-independent protein translocase protein TatB
MFPDIGGMEYLIIGVIALIVFKPQDLPAIAKRVGQFIASAKRMAADFRASFDDMARQSELDSLRKEVEAMRAEAAKAASDPVSSLTDVMANTAQDIDQAMSDPPANPIYDPAAWMGEDLPQNQPAPEPAPETKPRKARRAKAPEVEAKPKSPRKKPAAAKPARRKAAAK